MAACPPEIPSDCGSCGSTATCHDVATFSTVVGVVPDEFPVIIDIKPGSFPNSINTKSLGVIPVAILGEETFDFTVFDLATLSFGPGGATPAHGIHPEDVDGDGITDLVLHFATRETGLAVGDTEACIEGQTVDFGSGSLPITGCDSVDIVH